MYTIGIVYLENDRPVLKVNAKFGMLGNAWLEIDIPPEFYDSIMKLVDARVKGHEQLMRMKILGEVTDVSN